ncbi:D-amino acid dehydrogenase [Sneathiella glossodoripedis]|uniref:D-amino acid dehydrogenase n=1 Tax=Sneathiella glossodoripedis TaxID=418853 RepID=UPI00068663F4|nr:D-amino acid dehydrogenase [Sneathiella glossodoripedis]
MNVAVIGAGVIGINTAYQLAKQGCNVSVFDRNSRVAAETSFANGGQISISQPFPWNSPDVPRRLIKWLGRGDAPLLFRLQPDPFMWKWGIDFLYSANKKSFFKNALKVLKLAHLSKQTFQEINTAETFEFDHETRGILKLFSTKATAIEAEQLCEWLNKNGVNQKLLDQNELEKIEPALANAKTKLLGGTYSEIDESGDARKFTDHMQRRCMDLGVEFKFDTEVADFIIKNHKVSAIKTSQNEIFEFDSVVICNGVNARFLGQKIGLKIPVYPVKGYSVSIPVGNKNTAPKVSITDMEQHVVMSRLGNRLRAAGTAEINGYTTPPNRIREDMVLSSVRGIFPDAGDFDGAERWCGTRPMTTDCVPIIGPTPVKNLFLNVGHGHLVGPSVLDQQG